MRDDLLATPDDLLAHASRSDSARAREVMAGLSGPRLLDVVVGQGMLAVEPGRARSAGIDAVGELERAAVEMMGMPQGISGPAKIVPGTAGSATTDTPWLTGWEMMTVETAQELIGATTSLPVRPWHLALIAFADVPSSSSGSSKDRTAGSGPHRTGHRRSLTAASADGRLVTAMLRLPSDDSSEPDILSSCVTTRLEDVRRGAALAWGLRAALCATSSHG